MPGTVTCPVHLYRVRTSCQECWRVAEENRKLKLEAIEKRLRKRQEQNQRKRERKAVNKAKRRRRILEKWNTKGNCIWHNIPPVVSSGRRYCRRCYAASHRRTNRKKVDESEQKRHDENVRLSVHKFSRKDIRDTFLADIYRKAA